MKNDSNKSLIKRLSKRLIILLILFLIPEIPYKLPSSESLEGYIELKCEYTWLGELRVLEGKEKIDEYIKANNINNVTSKEIGIMGNTPFKELTTYGQGDYSYTYLTIYGNMTNKIDQEGNLVFNVEKWNPTDRWVSLKDTTIVYNFFNKLKLTDSPFRFSFSVMMIQLILLITFLFSLIKIIVISIKYKFKVKTK